ncbi:hypothetical protein CYY_007204 [Polysphondylium violaceum]|uniref:Pseudouridine synthase RsuA/RluA-like domain-containing protein n=1 Tax=Polysphondylium violaceum TaxID=133409 RepID=A0A8J4UY62_9MYCE|nr:hypothetical protein CYY_007204 [Polysphondylium violaceum]
MNNLLNKKLRLDRLLSNLGLCTRSNVNGYLNEKRVTCLGKKVSPSDKVNPKDIKIDGKPLEHFTSLSIAIHKPNGYICSTSPDGENKIIYDLLPKEYVSRKPILSIAGRLDKWVTGLVIMSQDGKLVERIITPKDDGCGKDYEVVLKDSIKGHEKELFESGTLLLRGEDKPCKPSGFQVLDQEKNKIKVTLYEGRYHQVRRMCAAVDNKAIEIHRTRVGPVELGDLPLGKWRFLSEKELLELNKIEATQTIKRKEKYRSASKYDNDELFGNEKEEQEEEDDDEEDYDQDDRFNEIDEEIDQDNQEEEEKVDLVKIDYEAKLAQLIQEEQGSMSKSIINPSGKLTSTISSSIQEQNPIEQEQEEDEEKEKEVKFNIEELNRSMIKTLNSLEESSNPSDPYQKIRNQIHDNFRAMILQRNKNAQFDENGNVLPKGKRPSRIEKDEMSDEELEKRIQEDEDFKIIKREMEGMPSDEFVQENDDDKVQEKNQANIYKIDSSPLSSQELRKTQFYNSKKRQTGKGSKNLTRRASKPTKKN